MNVDDVFLMLDGKTSKVDYVSPNVEKLLGITVEQIRQDIRVLGNLHPKNSANRDKNFLEELMVREQREWEFEYVSPENKRTSLVSYCCHGQRGRRKGKNTF